MNPLAKGIRDYLALRRGLGFKLVRHEAGLKEFASFLARKRSSHITVALALEWATQHAHQQPAEWAARLCVVRGFARYWSATDPLTEVPPLGLLPYRPARAQPYFYSDHEIRKLLRAAKTRPSIDPLRPWTYHCLFGLLAVTGLRLGEALGLRLGDMDWSEGILTIRGAKFGKSRLVPLHTSTCKVLADYAKRRDERFGARRRRVFPGKPERQPTGQRRGPPGVLPAVPTDWIACCGRQPRPAPARFSTPICGRDSVALVSQRRRPQAALTHLVHLSRACPRNRYLLVSDRHSRTVGSGQ